MHTYIHTHIYIHTHTYIYIYMYVYVCIYCTNNFEQMFIDVKKIILYKNN